jgi:hypothetical protein
MKSGKMKLGAIRAGSRSVRTRERRAMRPNCVRIDGAISACGDA